MKSRQILNHEMDVEVKSPQVNRRPCRYADWCSEVEMEPTFFLPSYFRNGQRSDSPRSRTRLSTPLSIERETPRAPVLVAKMVASQKDQRGLGGDVGMGMWLVGTVEMRCGWYSWKDSYKEKYLLAVWRLCGWDLLFAKRWVLQIL